MDSIITDNPIRTAFSIILDTYLSVKTEGFSYQSSIHLQLQNITNGMNSIFVKNDFNMLIVDSSCGKGNWSYIPWISIIDKRRTTSTQRGIYIDILFKQDMSGFYLTLNQGVTEPFRLGKKKGLAFLKDNAESIRQVLSDESKENLTRNGFRIDNNIFLSDKGLGKDYQPGIILHKYYGKNDTFSDETLTNDLEILSKIYINLPQDEQATNYWIFQANPKYYDLKSAVSELKELSFSISSHKEEMRVGDTVFLWISGLNAGIIALAMLKTEPELMSASERESKFDITPEKFKGEKIRAKIEVEKVLNEILTKEEIKRHKELQNLSILRAPQGTNFRISIEEADNLLALINSNPKVSQEPFDVKKFISDLQSVNLRFDDNFIIRFVSALCTKPFVILTGLSGSGKTGLALAFSDWISANDNQVCLLPVGADWTNREPLLGYPNALDPGRYIKPETGVIDLIIRAINNPDKPYFLLLDEMNLSHVERYFADFLSAMESEKSIPLHSNEFNWKDDVPATITLPKNLFIIGTVNVDETTYMFSPKVLDRAGVLEFRVTHDEMRDFLQYPIKRDITQLSGKGSSMAESFLHIANSDINKYPQSEALIEILALFFVELKKLGAEFGYRTASEVFRFGRMMCNVSNKGGELTPEEIADAAIVQKLLPKIHGSRRKLEPVLKSLMILCLNDGSVETVKKYIDDENINLIAETNVRFPISLEKLIRMYRHVIHDGFTSFAEA